jgi:hypothetical protein
LLSIQLEGPHNEGDTIANVYQGWFLPPETTNYRFYSACDDYCSVKLALTPDQSTETKTLLDTHAATDRRHYRREDNQERISEWVPLEKGKKYYIEADHQEFGGSDHFTVSVEIE